LVGNDSAHFWTAVDAVRAEIRTGAIKDSGHTEIDAPRALYAVCDGLAQSVLVRDSAFERVKRAGGPLTSNDRERRAFAVWESASASVVTHARLLGLERVAKTTDLARSLSGMEPRS